MNSRNGANKAPVREGTGNKREMGIGDKKEMGNNPSPTFASLHALNTLLTSLA